MSRVLALIFSLILVTSANAQIVTPGASPAPCTTFGTVSGTCVQGGAITAGGPIGSATSIPVITYNAAGQLTAVSTASISSPAYTGSTSWTPVVTASTTAGTPAYSVQVGTYEEMCPNGSSSGCFIHAQFNITLSGWTGSPSGNVSITGLPVASASTANNYASCAIGGYSVSSTITAGLTALITSNSTGVNLYYNAIGTNTALTATLATTTFSITGMCNYHT